MEKKCVIVPSFFHKELKKRATEKETTIETEIKEILEKEFVLEEGDNGE